MSFARRDRPLAANRPALRRGNSLRTRSDRLQRKNSENSATITGVAAAAISVPRPNNRDATNAAAADATLAMINVSAEMPLPGRLSLGASLPRESTNLRLVGQTIAHADGSTLRACVAIGVPHARRWKNCRIAGQFGQGSSEPPVSNCRYFR